MITVTVEENKIIVEGHAGYSHKGSDIVCAGVSALTNALESCLPGCVVESRDGYSRINLDSNGVKSVRYYIEMYVEGIKLIAEEFPENVRMSYGRKTEET